MNVTTEPTTIITRTRGAINNVNDIGVRKEVGLHCAQTVVQCRVCVRVCVRGCTYLPVVCACVALLVGLKILQNT